MITRIVKWFKRIFVKEHYEQPTYIIDPQFFTCILKNCPLPAEMKVILLDANGLEITGDGYQQGGASIGAGRWEVREGMLYLMSTESKATWFGTMEFNGLAVIDASDGSRIFAEDLHQTWYVKNGTCEIIFNRDGILSIP